MISKWVIEMLLGSVAKKLDGYTTKIGGIGSILSGIVGLLGHFFPDSGLVAMETEVAIGFIVTGWIALGIGNKLEKGNKIAKASQVENKAQAEQVTETLQAVADKECP
jgi:uncharacterized membrane protein HdeD (DUF308 family)